MWAKNIVLMAVGSVGLMLACSGVPSDGDDQVGGGAGAGDASSAAGAAEGGASAHGGQPGVDDPLSGQTGQAGHPSAGDEAGQVSEAGAAGEGGQGNQPNNGPLCNGPSPCLIDAQCDVSETCQGTPGAHLCVPADQYCDDAQPCVQNSAGCVDHRCLPPLASGATCSDSHQCSSGLCGAGNKCVEPPTTGDNGLPIGCCNSETCPTGQVCRRRGLHLCASLGNLSACVPDHASQGQICGDVPCAVGLECSSTPVFSDGYTRCLGPSTPIGQSCTTYVPTAQHAPGSVQLDCVTDAYCPAPASGVGSCMQCTSCKAKPGPGEACPTLDGAGNAVDCRSDAYCGEDHFCHAKLGQDCSASSCQAGFRCAEAVTQGGCKDPSAPSATSLLDQAFLKASNSDPLDGFGQAVALAGDTLVVGAPFEDGSAGAEPSDNAANAAGAVYVFVRSVDGWSEQARLKPAHADAGDNFGKSVALSGDTLVVGAPQQNSAALGVNGDPTNKESVGRGAAYVFVRSGSSWQQQAYLKASNPSLSFGQSIAISGDTVMVGAPAEQSSAKGVNGDQLDKGTFSAGAAYIFVRTGSTWAQQAYLKASNTSQYAQFGASVAVSGDTLAVGAFGEGSIGHGVGADQTMGVASALVGAAYVFVRNGSAWAQQVFIKPALHKGAGDIAPNFGAALALSGSTLVVGAPYDSSPARGIDDERDEPSVNFSGAAYVYQRDATQTWAQQAYVKSPTTSYYDAFGWSVATDGDNVAIGAPKAPLSRAYGRAFLVQRQGGAWVHRGLFRGSDQHGEFGGTVGLAGPFMAVGAWIDSSGASGVDGMQCNEDKPNSGAVYVGRF